MDAGEDDELGVGLGGLPRQAERVADEVRDVLDLGALVVVREDDRVALGSELADLGGQCGDVNHAMYSCVEGGQARTYCARMFLFASAVLRGVSAKLSMQTGGAHAPRDDGARRVLDALERFERFGSTTAA